MTEPRAPRFTAKTAAAGAGAMGAGVIALAAIFIPKWEGTETRAYFDSAKIPTVCTGHTGGVQFGRTYTLAECRTILAADLEKHAAAIRPCVPAQTPVESQAAFLSLAFNIGPSALCASSVARYLKAGDLIAACTSILAWNKYRDPKTKALQVSRGLAARRADERALCMRGAAS